MTGDSVTRVSLLGRLRRDPLNEKNWKEFVDQYGRRIYHWCRQWNLQEADAEDVTQNVLLRLAEKLREFDYDPGKSFRAWLKTLTRHAVSDFGRAVARRETGSGNSLVLQMLHSAAAREDLCKHLEEEFDRELLEEAILKVRMRVAPQTWEAFRLTALEGCSGAEAAKRIPMQVAQVFVAKRRVREMLREEVAKLDGTAEE